LPAGTNGRDEGVDQDILKYAAEQHCPELHMMVDEESGLKAIIAIHSTELGPALGGCRCIEYPSTTAAAIDAIRLAKGMTYKAAMARLPLGGGKMVVLKPKQIADRTLFFKAIGRAVDSLNGRYITAEDSGTSVADMDIIASTTPYVTGRTYGKLSVADPSIFTAQGTVRGIEAAVKYKLGKDSVKDIHIAIQGLGNVGFHMAKDLHELGARLTVYDINSEKMDRCVKEFKATAVQSFDELLTLNCDVFSPCALGAILNDDTIPKLKAPIVAGSANNQLAESRHGESLKQRGILYAPDYVISMVV
jgi:leucine dehydrogenase